MTKEINRKFEWMNEAEDYTREVFKGVGMGHGYHGRIVVKSRMVGYDAALNVVREYTNKYGKLYIIKGTYHSVVTNTKPQMSSEF